MGVYRGFSKGCEGVCSVCEDVCRGCGVYKGCEVCIEYSKVHCTV